MNWPTIGTIAVAVITGLFALMQLWIGWRLQTTQKQLERRENNEQVAAIATVQLESRRLEEGMAIRNDWKKEVDDLRTQQDQDRAELRQLMRDFAEQAKIIARQEGEITVLRERLVLLTEERDRLRGEAETLRKEAQDLRGRVRTLEPLQEQVKHLQAQVRELEARQQGRRATDGGTA